MQRIAFFTLTLIFFLILISPNSQAASEMTIYVNEQLVLMDTQPYVLSGTTLVPIRFVSAELGASVAWRDAKAEITLNNTKIVLTSNSKDVYVNGQKEELLLPVQEKDGRLLVPLRFISEHFGAQVNYSENTVEIITEHAPPLNEQGKTMINSDVNGLLADKPNLLYLIKEQYIDGMHKTSIVAIDKKTLIETIIIDELQSIQNGEGTDDNIISGINVVGSYLYYHYGGELRKVDLTTNQTTTIAKNAYRSYIIGDDIYYLDDKLYAGGLWKIKNDGTNAKKIVDKAHSFVIVGDTIYYSISAEKKVFAVSKEGNNNPGQTHEDIF